MEFNHLIEINDPHNPFIRPLTRDQVWRGLVQRAEDPRSFVLGLDRCIVTERLPDGLQRELSFGELRVLDRVTYEAPWRVRYDTEPTPDTPAATLTMSIEEPGEGALFVRFEYDSGEAAPQGSVEALYDDFRRNAYEQADIDTIARIRQLADEGRLDDPVNS